MVGRHPRHLRATVPRPTQDQLVRHRPDPTAICAQEPSGGRVGLYTFLYGNPLYRLYTTGIQPPLLVPARLSRYTAHTAHTAIQPYTPYIIQRHTASLRLPREQHGHPVWVACAHPLEVVDSLVVFIRTTLCDKRCSHGTGEWHGRCCVCTMACDWKAGTDSRRAVGMRVAPLWWTNIGLRCRAATSCC